jgi:hypothetical protein
LQSDLNLARNQIVTADEDYESLQKELNRYKYQHSMREEQSANNEEVLQEK